MYRLLRTIALVLMSLITIVFASSIVRGEISPHFEVWTASSLERVSRSPSSYQKYNFNRKNNIAEDRIQLQAARNEYESFQIVVQSSKNESISNVDVVVSDLHNGDRSTIGRQNITLYREHYIYVDRPSPSTTGNPTPGKGWYPDALIPFDDPVTGKDLEGATLDAVPFDLAKNSNQPIWVDVFVPQDAAPGKYRGTYTVTSDRGKSQGKIELEVWDFALPTKPTMHSYFNPWWDRGESMIEELLKHKVMPGKRIKPEQQAELIDRWGMNTVRIPFWSGANYQTCQMSPAPSVEEIKKASAAYDESLLKFVFSADEIDKCSGIIASIKQWAKNIHQAGIEHLVVMKPIPELYDDVDIWVVQPQMYRESQAQIAEVMKQGDSVWFYTGKRAEYSPQWQMDTLPINFRVPQGFIAQSLGLTGVLYPQVDGWADDAENLPVWSNDPWHQPSVYQQGEKNFPGEGMLLYPGAEVGIDRVIPSIRLKWIRDGIEDYEYSAMLKRLGAEELALKIVREVGRDWKNWTKKFEVLYSARQKLGDKIQQLSA